MCSLGLIIIDFLKEFEGEIIPNLVKQSEVQEAEDTEAQQNDYVLQRLLKKSGKRSNDTWLFIQLFLVCISMRRLLLLCVGVQSALYHDKIMMSSAPDYVIVEAEADRVAKQAARSLKQSRAKCNPAHMGRPNWTGMQGSQLVRYVIFFISFSPVLVILRPGFDPLSDFTQE